MVQPINNSAKPGLLQGLRVLELAQAAAGHCGLLLAGMGADVVLVEPPEGAAARRVAPFAHDAAPDGDNSLFFMAYHRDKRSAVLDLRNEPGRASLLALLAHTDVLLAGGLDDLRSATGLDLAQLAARFPSLVTARITPFGDDGPWKDLRASDLVHLALGGVMMNCGYDAALDGRFDLPPIAPQAFHAMHVACEQALVGILAALLHRDRTGEGQDVSCAMHTAIATSTEMDLMSWVMRAAPQQRQTCRPSAELPNRSTPLAATKDGRFNLGWLSTAGDEANLVAFLRGFGMAADLTGPDPSRDPKAREVQGATGFDERKAHFYDVVQRFVRCFRSDDLPWKAAQDAGLMWSPLRLPHENLADPHWQARGSYADIEGLPYPRGKWLATGTEWKAARRAPRLGEHTREVLTDARPRVMPTDARPRVEPQARRAPPQPALSRHGKPFALQGVRILDFSWFLASAGGTRMCAALGAECLKVEWKANADSRMGAMAPVGGREARRNAKAPLAGIDDPAMGGHFNHKNAGKRGLSLNVRDARGLDIARRLVAISDVVAEGFSPGVMERWGLGHDALKAIRPDIVYVQQSGMGTHGLYGRMRTVGPIAQAFTGLSEMSGLPHPAPPAGWGYSYLDWMGAYGFAQAILAGLHHRNMTGEGQWIDASQCEAGLMLTGVPLLDWAVNGRAFQRTGNRPAWQAAAPHGAYRCAGEDRWVAIACFDERDWNSLVAVSGQAQWASDARFATLASRIANHDALDAEIGAWTSQHERYALMAQLQSAGIAAGVCQTAEDRCDNDPQLAQQKWMTEVTAPKIGTWPVTELPFHLSATPSHIGGLPDRGAPLYGEDNDYVLGELLGFGTADIAHLAADGVI